MQCQALELSAVGARSNSALGVAAIHLKVQFDPVSGRILEKQLSLPGQRDIVNVERNSVSLQSGASGWKICAREGNMVKGRDDFATTLLALQSLGEMQHVLCAGI